MALRLHGWRLRITAAALAAVVSLLTSCTSSQPSATPVPTPGSDPTSTVEIIPASTVALIPTPTKAKQTTDLKPCTLAMNIKAECGTYSVYEDREARSGRKIDLRVAVVKAKTEERAPDAMVYLAGGPGGSAVQDFTAIGPAFRALNQRHDWLLVDQRGTGGSNSLIYPNLPPEAATITTAEQANDILRPWLQEALKTLDGDPRFYTTMLAVDDIDEVAQALGYKQVNLYGGSYGATTVQYYLRLHPDHVRTAIMDGGTMVDVPIFEMIAPNGQRALEMVFARCEADEFCRKQWPNVRSEMQEVFDRLGKEPATVHEVLNPATEEPIVLTQGMFAEAVRNRLLRAADTTSIPRMIHHAYEGNYVDIAASYLNQQSQNAAGAQLVMSMAIRCSESWAVNSPEETARLGKGTYFVENQVLIARQTEIACGLVPRGPVPANDGERVKSDVPVLLMNGDTDPQDPPENVANAQKELPNSLSVIVPGQGHGVIQTGCLYKVAQQFVDGGTAKGLDTSCVQNMTLPPFDLSE